MAIPAASGLYLRGSKRLPLPNALCICGRSHAILLVSAARESALSPLTAIPVQYNDRTSLIYFFVSHPIRIEERSLLITRHIRVSPSRRDEGARCNGCTNLQDLAMIAAHLNVLQSSLSSRSCLVYHFPIHHTTLTASQGSQGEPKTGDTFEVMWKRRWNTWPARFGISLVTKDTPASILGLILTVVGFQFSTNIAIYLGILCICVVLCHLAYISIPKRLLSVLDLAKNKIRIRLEDLNDLDQPVRLLGVAGTAQSGKSTFVNQVLHNNDPAQRTNRLEAVIAPLPTVPQSFVALLDGDGSLYGHQFEVCVRADIIVIFLDHSDSENDTNVSRDRLNVHEQFLHQLYDRIAEARRNQNKPTRLYFLLNKRDLWEKIEDNDEIEMLKTWFCERVNYWKGTKVVDTISADLHSNKLTEDLTRALSEIGN